MDLLRDALVAIQKRANEHLENVSSKDHEWVTLSTPLSIDGAINEGAQDKIVMLLYNIKKEETHSGHASPQSGPGGFAILPPPLYINLELAFIANFTARRYTDGLSALSRLISYFQQTPVLTQTNAPELDPSISKLTLDFVNLDTVDVNYVMSMLGIKYMPSVFYQLRMLTFNTSAIQRRAPAVLGTRVVDPGAPGGGG